MTTITKFLAGIVLWLGVSLISARASALVVNVDFNGNFHSPTNYTGQGALVTADAHYWNALNTSAPTPANPTISSLLASDGTTVTPISVSLFNVLEYNYAFGGPNPSGNALMDDIYFNAGYVAGTPSTFSINGLTAGKTYDLYLYGNAAYNLNVNEYFQIGATQKPVTGRTSGANATGSPNFWVSGTDYALFQEVVANGSGQITGSFGADAGFGAVISGLQIQEVPEPGTILLLSVGSVLLCRRSRRG